MKKFISSTWRIIMWLYPYVLLAVLLTIGYCKFIMRVAFILVYRIPRLVHYGVVFLSRVLYLYMKIFILRVYAFLLRVTERTPPLYLVMILALALLLFAYTASGAYRLRTMIVISSVALGGCGFQLASEEEVFAFTVPASVQIADAPLPLANALSKQMEYAQHSASGAPLVTVHIVASDYQRLAEVVDSSGRIKSYRLLYTVAFHINNNASHEKSTPSEVMHVQVQRYMDFDARQVLASAHREQYLQEKMYAEVARLILWRVQSTLSMGLTRVAVTSYNDVK